MKLIISGVAAPGGLAWYLNGGAGGPDASREVAKAPAQVYAEFASMSRHLPDFAVNQMVEDMATAIEHSQPVSKDMLFPLMRSSS
jgi:hypothetical protein